MVWQKKAAAPDYLNQLATFRVALTGTADDWLLPWINLVDWGNALDVNAFCALGPPVHPVFTIDDFLAGIVGGPVGAGVTVLSLREKIRQRAQEILFGSLCENDATGVWGEWQCFDLLGPVSGQADMFLPYPAGADQFQIKYGPAIDHLPGQGQANLYRSLAGAPTEATRFGRIGGNYAAEQAPDPAEAVGAFDSLYFSIKLQYELRLCVRFHGGFQSFPVPEIEQPDSAIPPDPGAYVTIADLGAELDAIEQKLHWVLNWTSGQLATSINPLVADESIEIADPDEDVELGPDVMGFIVTLSAIPGSADERFGSPLQLHKLGRVVMGNGTAWLPPIDLTVSPMLLLRPDPTVTKCRVHTFPPTTATVTTLVRAPAVG